MKLTRRQEEFVRNLMDLGREMDGPIHYSLLAERLGVSRFTAYDMLRVLEDKGFVRSEYQLAAGRSGPGRAERLFFPTDAARRRFQELGLDSDSLSLEGAGLRKFLQEKMRSGEIDPQEFGIDLPALIPPDGPDPLRYCMEVMGVVALRLQRRQGRRLAQESFSDILPDCKATTRSQLCLFGGFAFGLLAAEDNEDQEWTQMLVEHMDQYQKIVLRLSPHDSLGLGEHLKKLFGRPRPTNLMAIGTQ